MLFHGENIPFPSVKHKHTGKCTLPEILEKYLCKEIKKCHSFTWENSPFYATAYVFQEQVGFDDPGVFYKLNDSIVLYLWDCFTNLARGWFRAESLEVVKNIFIALGGLTSLGDMEILWMPCPPCESIGSQILKLKVVLVSSEFLVRLWKSRPKS